jgi:hypothetical protein
VPPAIICIIDFHFDSRKDEMKYFNQQIFFLYSEKNHKKEMTMQRSLT